VAKDEDRRVLERKVKEEDDDDANGLGNEESECDCILSSSTLCALFIDYVSLLFLSTML
jgi:hypothetical protein